MKRLLTLCILVLVLAGMCDKVCAQTSIVGPNYSIPSKIGPAYFGPNAFPVPDMLDGRTSSTMKVEIYGDGFLGTTTGRVADDLTGDVFVRLTTPLFTPKANLTVWMPIFEAYYTSAEVNALRRLQHKGDLRGVDSGDVYISTDINLLNSEQHGVDVSVRAAMKTASANKWADGRCYDSPGYFFDVAAGREVGESGLRVAASGGFLCWQTDNGRQNDAVMYGLLLAYRPQKANNRFAVDACLGGYVGWEGDGDCPMTLKTNVSWRVGDVWLRVGHQVGLIDWPYHQIRLGVSYSFDILSTQRRGVK